MKANVVGIHNWNIGVELVYKCSSSALEANG